jgi:hypothetical protein
MAPSLGAGVRATNVGVLPERAGSATTGAKTLGCYKDGVLLKDLRQGRSSQAASPGGGRQWPTAAKAGRAASF